MRRVLRFRVGRRYRPSSSPRMPVTGCPAAAVGMAWGACNTTSVEVGAGRPSAADGRSERTKLRDRPVVQPQADHPDWISALIIAPQLP